MGDVLKDLSRARPATPEVDPERMERDLAQILTLPRPHPPGVWRGQAALRRLAPVLVGVGVVAVLLIALLPSDRTRTPAGPGESWRVHIASSQLTVVGSGANSYVLELRTDIDRWLAPKRQLVVTANGHVGWRSEADLNRWLAAGSPSRVPVLGAQNKELRVGPVRASASETTDGSFSDTYDQVVFAERDTWPSDPGSLLATVESLVGGTPYATARVAMAMTATPLRVDQRRAALDLLRKLPGVRDNGVGLAITAPAAGQFTGLETQLVVDLETAQAISIRTVLTAAEHGLPAGAVVESQDFSLVGTTHEAPQVPADVLVNAEPDSPFIMVR
ncbi:hypothetical protein BBK82_14735 [Lentzea guizhouensis]|uniref:Uncharacterized protein n=1 Tax=Lentzea guizhouensis TaxID=1586287 RepID=A0A1B2HHE6_9PSEU|nr:hypothetical protein [Lentzea guizhouensis]ANZ37134.1 hypothetical protein BBK82_14735 [Lentzea guizhouensis]